MLDILEIVGILSLFLENVGRRNMGSVVIEIGSVLEQKREKRGISYAELSRRLGLNEDMTSRFCKGKSMPNGVQLLLMCRELELDVDDFPENNDRKAG